MYLFYYFAKLHKKTIQSLNQITNKDTLLQVMSLLSNQNQNCYEKASLILSLTNASIFIILEAHFY